MGREILFKGKRKDTGEWIQGSYFDNKELGIHYIMVWNGEHYAGHEVIEETVAQFIGHVACEKVKVFDKDLLKDPEYGNIYLVKWLEDETGYILREVGINRDNTECIIDMLYEDGDWIKLEVVGTLHDNPELLEVE